jgi:hypothetical protein
MIAEARGIASIPEELRSAEAAPLLCADITTYNALRNAGLRGGDLPLFIRLENVIPRVQHVPKRFTRSPYDRRVMPGKPSNPESKVMICSTP